MSDSPAPPAPRRQPFALSEGNAAPIVSIVQQAIFVIVFVGVGYLAYLRVDGAMAVLTTLAGVAATKAATVVDYYLGSSAGSAKKTDMMAAQQPPPRTAS